ncbi:transcription factor 7-like 1-A [Cyclopterus lumpus]|uniref:transcription factor 7-like 1-A n=1 Tax=Cyclopterus lumpus TaxID=8103 RepID=UPI001486BCC9|nr:transcription factor 7-like 1-A [Cyclopterus lumpus]
MLSSFQWKSLSNEEQAKYYQQANGEKRLHAQCHPDWTPGNNYGVKRKKDRSMAAKLDAKLAKASTSGEVTQPAKKLCAASVSTAVVEAPPTNIGVMEAFRTSSVLKAFH